MKRIVIMLFVVASTLWATAQDVIFLGANDSIVAKVLSVGTSEITYKKWSNLEGPDYSISINQIAAIRYANGTYDFFNKNNTNSSHETSPSANRMQLTRSGNYNRQNQMSPFCKTKRLKNSAHIHTEADTKTMPASVIL